jgi:hypothetical protein
MREKHSFGVRRLLEDYLKRVNGLNRRSKLLAPTQTLVSGRLNKGLRVS